MRLTTNPNGVRHACFITHEVTAPTLDVSPDGTQIVFDLLGDLYLLSIRGGVARPLTHGTAWNSDPRFSPDGTSIVFVSDSGGASNIWLMRVADGHARQVTKDDGWAFLHPLITPDGSHIIVSASHHADGNYDLWTLPLRDLRGDRSRLRLLTDDNTRLANQPCEATNQQKCHLRMRFEPSLASGLHRLVYVTARLGPIGDLTPWHVVEVTMSGDSVPTSVPLPVDSGLWNRSLHPIISSDGRSLVYAHWQDTSIVWRLRDLVSGADSALMPPDPHWAFAEYSHLSDLSIGASFVPDARAVVLAHDGGIWLVDLPSHRISRIDFTAVVNRELAPLARFHHTITDAPLLARHPVDVRPSPDGRQLAFSALDHLYLMALPRGKPQRLTDDEAGEFEPAWAPDGQHLSYVTWNDTLGGTIRSVALDADAKVIGSPVATRAPTGMFTGLAYTSDGSQLIAGFTPYTHAVAENDVPGYGIVQIDSTLPGWDKVRAISLPGLTARARFGRVLGHRNWTSATEIFSAPNAPLFQLRASASIYVSAPGALDEINPITGKRRRVLNVPGAIELQVSHDQRRVLVSSQIGLYVIGPLVKVDTSLSIDLSSPDNRVPVRCIDPTEADWIGWSQDQSRVYYTRGSVFYTVALDGGARTADTIAVSVARDKPSATIVFRNARVITMRGDEVLDHGDVIVRDNRIAAVVPTGADTVIPGATVLDLTGKTLMPGWVDVHHHVYSRWSRFRSQPWQFLSDLSFGATAIRDPLDPIELLCYADRADAGHLLAPRIFATGEAVVQPPFAGRPLFADVAGAMHVLRYFEANHTETAKQELLGWFSAVPISNRRVRQAYVQAARNLHLTPTVHQLVGFHEDMTLLLDGYSGHEHTYPVGAVYDDVAQLSAASGLVYTQTLGIQFGWSRFIKASPIHSDLRIARFMPGGAADSLDSMARIDSTNKFGIAQMARQGETIARAGGIVAMGSHGDNAGPAMHWEMWAMAEGGMPNLSVLRAATLNGAIALGHEADFGSIEIGKLADLQVLDGNPLDDIHNTWLTRYVMKNGRLYDAATLTEVYPRNRLVGRLWWSPIREASVGSISQ